MNIMGLGIDLINEWKQIFTTENSYNWIDFHFVKLKYEKAHMYGTKEVEIYLFGFGIRLYWVYDIHTLEKKLAEYERRIEEFFKNK